MKAKKLKFVLHIETVVKPAPKEWKGCFEYKLFGITDSFVTEEYVVSEEVLRDIAHIIDSVLRRPDGRLGKLDRKLKKNILKCVTLKEMK